VGLGTVVDARKARLGETDALALAAAADRIIAARGKKVVTLLMKDKPEKDAILAAMLGPTGNLRAPVLRKGRTLFVGFPESALAEFLER
jgi:arsenate reductase-like glutaredoxin family protein